jgi:hypothetical protein
MAYVDKRLIALSQKEDGFIGFVEIMLLIDSVKAF